jgi:membrane protein
MTTPDSPAPRGRAADQPTGIPKKGWLEVLWRTKAEINNDNLSVIAAGVAFFAFLSIPAILTATVALWGLVSDPEGIQAQIGQLAGVLPGEVRAILVDQLTAIATNSDTTLGWTVILSIGFALWSASKGTRSAITAMNVAYEEKEERGFLKLTATTLLLTFGAVMTVIVALFCVAGIPALLAGLNLPGWIEWTAQILRWPLLAGVSLVALAVLYRVAPDRNSPRWTWVTPGSLVSTALLLAASAGFSYYVSSFGKYNETYGSLGGVVVLLLWLYISAFIILLGGELNSELEHQTAKDTTVGPPKPLGQRDAAMADTVAE